MSADFRTNRQSLVHCQYRIECGDLVCYSPTQGMAESIGESLAQQEHNLAVISRVAGGTLTEIYPDLEYNRI